ncbi:hypothetical protein SAY86_023848 [Trapa natans]|uniref:Uncharacterized protein n=1 Tax=Trapa natans TaxID=22666 RepID=A0AAN7RBV9_TRANT|nr:hypothetical protein SAY86_023848 [Trapa natans]
MGLESRAHPIGSVPGLGRPSISSTRTETVLSQPRSFELLCGTSLGQNPTKAELQDMIN